ncbi:MAG: glycosyltransferase family 2 protein, partial [Oscillatoria sp. PMC 1076.18]|nr:glycosyltransferase family 2 protein [Oscillatoria sp. PMC 1076.18]
MIAIVIPVRNRQSCTRQVLTQLSAQIEKTNSKEEFAIVVVDDGSTDGTKAMVKQEFPEVHLIAGDGSLWWTGAIVKGMEYALNKLNPKYLVWLNDDIFLKEDLIENLRNICLSASYAEKIVGGIVRDKTYPDWIVYSGSNGLKPINDMSYFVDSEEIKVEDLCGNIVVIPRMICDRIGLPDATRLPHHGGDYEYIRRARKQGFQAILSSKLQADSDFQVSDFIRYMPYWMQWYFEPNLMKRWQILKGLASLKFNQNVWVYVNLHSQNINSKNTPFW